ncbi:efflux RND transporter permease subunit [Denitromonas iodatirespirans]|uniref:Efflux pump membrane transporter n=1 Tax=Denitromonas iodatirespirans TaxID=2795389 RepID=A0A944D4F5_DENI1|nr:efflux RND transporter permease subunit [Denitromonas iodatirespirans]MBT0959744.1 efflux RND transporter permease subunit [Denitromonas iodatirespirans]
MARFFIDRPIFAWVIAIVIMLAGALAIVNLPVAQYPSIAPPAIAINASYPGASAKTAEDSVTQVIEQKLTGIDGLLYIGSTTDSFGNVTITLTFDADTDPDIAQVQTQNKVQQALPLLPQAVQNQGVTVAKSARNFLMVAGFVSEDGRLDAVDLSDFLVSSVQDAISRVDGVGEVTVFGSQYAMRIWLDPDKLHKYRLATADVTAAVAAQNTQVSAGQLGGAPAVPGQGFSATITAQSRLQTVSQFEDILLRSAQDGGEVRLRDVARIEIGAQSYETVARFNGQPAAGMGIRLASGANALETADRIRAKLDEMAPYFPAGVKYVIPYDTTPFVRISIEEVVKTLVEAVILVFLVMYLFLQNFRATLIPTIAVPVVLLGTFAVMQAFGFSINTLTMFGMVLAIGLLVDDAIVVVENVERVMSEEGLPPKEATKRSMGQITGALVGIGLVLSAVFVPMAFFGGSTGVIYRQFSITIVAAMALSVLVAIVFTPALCATMLKPVKKGHEHGEGSLFSGFFHWFNVQFGRATLRYESAVAGMIKRSLRFLLIFGVIVGLLGFLFVRLPTAFLPEEDQGVMFTQVVLPAGATQERTLEVLRKVEKQFLVEERDTVRALFTVAGFSFAGRGQNMGIGFVNLQPWDERTAPGQDVVSLQGRAMAAFSRIREAMVFAFVPPAVLELGTSGGFTMELQDRAGLGHDALLQARNQLLGLAAQDPRLAGVRPNGQEDTPQFKLDIDLRKAGALGVSPSDINSTLATAWGGTYVNDFVDRGRIKRVYVQADAPARMTPDDVNKWYVRNSSGEMVPFSAFASTRWVFGPQRLERFNGQPAMQIQGAAAPGYSSGEAMAAMSELVGKLPPGIGYAWSGTSYQEQQSGDQAPALLALSLLIVFLCLAALYESWSIPFAVMLVVPLGVLGAVLAATGRGLSNDIYFQVGLLATIGLSAKNAILIVEFAKAQIEEAGKPLVDATLEAVRMRLRPILMTSLAFGFGVLPLALASGAGAGSQNAIGTGVLGGVIAATALGIFFVPLFFVVIKRVFSRHTDHPVADTQPQEAN